MVFSKILGEELSKRVLARGGLEELRTLTIANRRDDAERA